MTFDAVLSRLRGKSGLVLDTHYRHVSKATWNAFERYYPNSGPTVTAKMEEVEDPNAWTVVNGRMGMEVYREKTKTVHKER